ncbi:hypothetical protein CesoFtcFv8_010858 [Champsocephalus esox]|uniref:Uncharacterized protein n=2 Tax=Champsocephalus TaxID=52236 RepID=A0AAN8HNV3_CHAGU|nr:hypothetical protein CesoFtcFv8_010858 [Champsocephalus esox]KAK5923179.1 hypothetical protein CgunFtcFv8_000172 [Champsocephalus gunnari]
MNCFDTSHKNNTHLPKRAVDTEGAESSSAVGGERGQHMSLRSRETSVLSARTHRGANSRPAAHPLPVTTEGLTLWGVAAALGLVHMMTVRVSS